MQNHSLRVDLSAAFTKVSENGSKTGIRITFESKDLIFNSIKADKVDLLDKATKLKKGLISLDIDFNNEEIEKIIDIAIKTLKTDKASNDSEKLNIKATLRVLYEKAISEPSEDTIYVAGEYMYINTLSLSEIFECEKLGWKPLDFKRQLRDMDLLEINTGRSFDFKKNSSRVKGNAPIWFLKIKLKNRFMEIYHTNIANTGGEVA